MPVPTPKDRKEILEQGAKILAPALVPNGFKFHFITSGRGSGGAFAEGEFVRGDRKLELHFRYSLGLVTYHIGKLSLAHGDYMRALLDKNGKNHYPVFSEEPLAGFEALRQDLVEHCSDFINGNGEQFCQCVEKNKKYESLTGFQKMESAQSKI
ncbi:MAG TPA: hypothetical protein VHG71_03915 [Verrucomicrobiae bacterium]|nr:hypothetical protein [Verrucomicrobiae bacterium]